MKQALKLVIEQTTLTSFKKLKKKMLNLNIDLLLYLEKLENLKAKKNFMVCYTRKRW